MTDFSILREETRGRVTLRLEGVFHATAAHELKRAILAEGAERPLQVDFSRTRQLLDFGLSVLAQDLTSGEARDHRVQLAGLRQHQLRLLRYFGLDASAAPAPA